MDDRRMITSTKGYRRVRGRRVKIEHVFSSQMPFRREVRKVEA